MTYKCPTCGATLDDKKDLVAKRYPSGLLRKYKNYDRAGLFWYCEKSTVSNTLYYRCKCGSNVHVKITERVEVVE